MEITRLTRLLGADTKEVEDLIGRLEQRDPNDRTELLAELVRALRIDELSGDEARGVPDENTTAREPSTDLADAVAIDLGFD